MKNFVLRGNICYSKNINEIVTSKRGYVVVENGVSQGVFSSLPKEYENYPLKDYGDYLIIPGMCDMHIHAPQYSYRGTGMDLQLLPWLNTYAFPEESKFSNIEYADRAYEIFADEMKKGATTRACVFATLHKDATLLLMDKMEKSGLVSYIGKVNMDRNSPSYLSDKTSENSLGITTDVIEQSKDKYKNTKPILTPRFVPSCSDDLMEGLGKIQNKYDVPVQSHLSENPDEIKLVLELRKDVSFYGEAYDKSHLFGGFNDHGKEIKTIMAHCVWSSPEEVELMKERGVYIAHCPASNTNIASGIAPIRKYLEKGLKICLGTDVAGGHSDSMFRAITDAIQVSKLYYRHVDNSKKPLVFEEAFYFATMGGGEFFGKAGSFEKGYEFDAIIIDDNIVPHPQPMDIRSRLERSVYLSFDERGGIKGKYVRGEKII